MRRYYNLEIEKTVSVTGLKTVEDLSLDADFFYPAETHGFYELIFVIDGEIFCKNDGVYLKLNAGEFKLTLPNVSHRYYAEKKGRVFVLCFNCKSNALSVLDKPAFLVGEEKNLMERLIAESERSFELPFKERIVLKKDAPIGARQLTENVLEELLILLLRKQLGEDEIYGVKDKSELQLNLVNDITNILKNNLYGSITLSDVCKMTFYSNTFLNGIFRKHKKTTIMRYYSRLKIEESKRLLKKGLSVSEISEKLCFDNPNYFGKTFKSITGLTPAKYKKFSCPDQKNI
ncbi:MAG: helix-turn-helix domain-containing protein [Clostridia bacterium]|nr:helix-turn-helix domain-containing protein [Clostridia bacterium]